MHHNHLYVKGLQNCAMTKFEAESNGIGLNPGSPRTHCMVGRAGEFCSDLKI